MNPSEYATMFGIEDSYWWYQGLHDLVLRWVRGRQRTLAARLQVLDAGCGTGRLLQQLRQLHDVDAAGIERSENAFPFLRKRGLSDVRQGSVAEMPYPDNSFDVVTSMDVLYCVPAPDDTKAIGEFHRVLRKGGKLVLNLPAYEFLRSHHDAAIHTQRRYRAGMLHAALKSAGFRVEQLSYRNMLLFPVAAAVRLAQKVFKAAPSAASVSDLKRLPAWINSLLLVALLIENVLLRAGAKLPFGLSVFCVATKD